MTQIAVRGFSKSFRTLTATRVVACADWSVDGAQPIWLVGPNGSGKTTLLRSMSGWIVSYHGEITLGGEPVERLWVPENKIAFAPADDFLPRGQSLQRIVRTFARYAGLPAVAFATRFERERELLGGADIAGAQRGGWSTGETRILSLALVLALDRTMVILDEPFSGLDERRRGALGARLSHEVKRGHVVVYTDHREQAVALASTRVKITREPH